MKRSPCILLFAGPNGSGKSTITGQYSVVEYYVNADEIQRIRNCDALEAGQIAHETKTIWLRRNRALRQD